MLIKIVDTHNPSKVHLFHLTQGEWKYNQQILPSIEPFYDYWVRAEGIGYTEHFEEAKMKAMIEAIRSSKVIGRGTCSVVDECMDDKELAEEITEEGITTVKDALKYYGDIEELQMGKMLDQRFGDDDDVQLKIAKEFEDRKEQNK